MIFLSDTLKNQIDFWGPENLKNLLWIFDDYQKSLISEAIKVFLGLVVGIIYSQYNISHYLS